MAFFFPVYNSHQVMIITLSFVVTFDELEMFVPYHLDSETNEL